MSVLRWLFSTADQSPWPNWMTSVATLTVSAVVIYQGLNWLNRKLIVARSKNDRDVVVCRPGRVDIRNQSRLLPGPDRIRASVLTEGDQYLLTLDPNVTTVYENFLRGLRVSGDGPCLGYRPSGTQPFHWITYGQVLTQAHNFGAGLIELGLKAGTDSFVGIYARNCAEWVIGSVACMSYSTVVVPLYDTLGLEAVHFIIGQADIDIVVCDSYEKATKLLSGSTRRLKHIVFMRGLDTAHPLATEVQRTADEHGVQLHHFDEVIARGQQHAHPLVLPSPDDLYMICYTSGTTGNPKGVMLTHKNLVCNSAAGFKVFEEYGIKLYPGEAVISYLPLAHMFEQMVHMNIFYHGGKMGMFRGDINGLADDMKALQPAYLPAVPRLLNRFYDKVQSTLASSPFKRFLFNWAVRSKLAEMRRGIIRKDSLWDRLIFNKIQRELGGHVRISVTGSAPIRDEVLSTVRGMLGSLVLEAYGQTECTAGATVTLPFDLSSGHVGGVMPCCHIKLVDAPELDYYARNDEGEICIRGPSVTIGYFRDPDRTKEILDQDGWLHTGDVGRWLPNNTLKIIDRKKHIFKLAQGEYVAPEKIENVYSRSPLVGQVFVDGNSFQRYLVAIVVPDQDHFRQWASSNGFQGTKQQLYNDDQVSKALVSELNKVGKKLGLSSLEQVKAVHLAIEPFTIDNGLLTPTLKLKRPQLRKHFKQIIDHLYQQINQ